MKEMPKTYIRNLVSRWRNYIQNEKWQIIVRKFWCLPNNYNELKSIDPWLYKTLSESKLIILKGDINYQKALGDYNRNPEIPLSIALDSFHLTNTVFVRILKSDLICGLDKTTAKKLDTFIRNISKGYLGIIQFTDKPQQPQCLLE
ncbi:hypothetical protein WA026_017445 [Henosepilachna vigintioctopunctata]|uniref:Sugar phosphate phosphatase n=1 Tax=Henosepilachna vigintioctopunctata TaxID=420089 RepID=A0AAW1VI11_9CUCU